MPWLQALLKRRFLTILAMGFFSGLPLLLGFKTLQAWLQDVGLNLGTIGLFALVGLPYSLKFLWAPWFDRPAFLHRLGRRRSWLVAIQAALAAALLLLGASNPGVNPWLCAALAMLVSFLSASQDIAIDAYRRERLEDHELGLGSSLFVYGYRAGMLVSGAVALFLADLIPWPAVYACMAGVMLLGIVVTLTADEPALIGPPPRTLAETFIEPLREFFLRPAPLAILLFMVLYKLGDVMAGSLTTPFMLQAGFTKTDIAAIAKTFGMAAMFGGLLVGGLVLMRVSLMKALFGFGILQSLSTLSYVALAEFGTSQLVLAGVIGFEEFTAGLGTAALTTYLSVQCNRRFSATQFALFSSLIGVPRVFLASPSGFIADALGWTPFFVFCAALAIPGLLLIAHLPRATAPVAEPDPVASTA